MTAVRVNPRRAAAAVLPLRRLPGAQPPFRGIADASEFVAGRFARNALITRVHRQTQLERRGGKGVTPDAPPEPRARPRFDPVPWNARWGVYLPGPSNPSCAAIAISDTAQPDALLGTGGAATTASMLSGGATDSVVLVSSNFANAAVAPYSGPRINVSTASSNSNNSGGSAMAMHADPLYTAAGLYYSQDAASQLLAALIETDADSAASVADSYTAHSAQSALELGSGFLSGGRGNDVTLGSASGLTEHLNASSAVTGAGAVAGRPLRVLDLCAAPGGKSTLLAATLAPGSLLISNEIDPRRARVLVENMLRHAALPAGAALIVTNAAVEAFTARRALTDAAAADATDAAHRSGGAPGGRLTLASVAALRAHPPRQTELPSLAALHSCGGGAAQSRREAAAAPVRSLAGSAALVSSLGARGPLAAAGVAADAPGLRRYARGSTALALPGTPRGAETVLMTPLGGPAAVLSRSQSSGGGGGPWRPFAPPAAALGEPAGLESFFDLVILDAPCSGSAMFRREPAAAAAWTPSMPRERAELQHALLGAALPLAQRLGGRLLYMTCSLDPVENQHVVARAHRAGLRAAPAIVTTTAGSGDGGNALRQGVPLRMACPEPVPLPLPLSPRAAASAPDMFATAQGRAVADLGPWRGPEPPVGRAVADAPVAPVSTAVARGAAADLLPLDFPALKRAPAAWGLVETVLTAVEDPDDEDAAALRAALAAPARTLLSASSSSSSSADSTDDVESADLPKLPVRAHNGPAHGGSSASSARGLLQHGALSLFGSVPGSSGAVAASPAERLSRALWLDHATYLALPSRARLEGSFAAGFVRGDRAQVLAAAAAALEANSSAVGAALANTASAREAVWRLRAAATPTSSFRPTAAAEVTAAAVTAADAGSPVAAAVAAARRALSAGGRGAPPLLLGDPRAAVVSGAAAGSGASSAAGGLAGALPPGVVEAEVLLPHGAEGPAAGEARARSEDDPDCNSAGGDDEAETVWLALGPGARVGGFLRASPALVRALASWVRVPAGHCLLLRVRADDDARDIAAAAAAGSESAAAGRMPASHAVKSNANLRPSANAKRRREGRDSRDGRGGGDGRGGDAGSIMSASHESSLYSPLRSGPGARRLDEDGAFAAEIALFPEAHLPVLQWLTSRVLPARGAGCAPVPVLAAGVPVGTLRFALPAVAAGLLEDAVGAAASAVPHGSPALSSPRAGVRLPLDTARFTPAHTLALAAAELLPPRRLRRVVALTEAEAVAFTTATGAVPLWLLAATGAASPLPLGARDAERSSATLVPPAADDMGVPLRAAAGATDAAALAGGTGWTMAEPLSVAAPARAGASGELRLAVSPEGVPLGWMQWRRDRASKAGDRKWHSLFPEKWRLVKVQPFGDHASDENGTDVVA